MNFMEIFHWLAEIVGEQYGIPGGPAKSDYPDRSAESEKIQEPPVTERPDDPKQKLASSRLGAKLDKEFWETF